MTHGVRVTLTGKLIEDRVPRTLVVRLAKRHLALIRRDIAIKGTGRTGHAGVKWAPLSQAGRESRAYRDPRIKGLIAKRKSLTAAEARLMSEIRGNGTLPRGSDNAQVRRDIIGTTICNTTEYRRIRAEQAEVIRARDALIDELGRNPVGVSTGAMFESFNEGSPGNVFEIAATHYTIGSDIEHSAMFDKRRTLIPETLPVEVRAELESMLIEGLVP